jgi:hypothetical protein
VGTQGSGLTAVAGLAIFFYAFRATFRARLCSRLCSRSRSFGCGERFIRAFGAYQLSCSRYLRGARPFCGLRPRRKSNVHEINAYRGCNCGTRAWLSRVRAIAARCLLRSDLGVATDSEFLITSQHRRRCFKRRPTRSSRSPLTWRWPRLKTRKGATMSAFWQPAVRRRSCKDKPAKPHATRLFSFDEHSCQKSGV